MSSATKWGTTSSATLCDGLIFTAVLVPVRFSSRASRLLRWAVRRYGGRVGPARRGRLGFAAGAASVAFGFWFLFTPIDNAFSRHIEHQADQYGLEVVHGIVPDAPEVAAHAFQVLGEVDLEEPSPSWLVKIWFYDHPPIDERMEFSRTYDPWAKGQSPEFVK